VPSGLPLPNHASFGRTGVSCGVLHANHTRRSQRIGAQAPHIRTAARRSAQLTALSPARAARSSSRSSATTSSLRASSARAVCAERYAASHENDAACPCTQAHAAAPAAQGCARTLKTREMLTARASRSASAAAARASAPASAPSSARACARSCATHAARASTTLAARLQAARAPCEQRRTRLSQLCGKHRASCCRHVQVGVQVWLLRTRRGGRVRVVHGALNAGGRAEDGDAK